MNHRHKDRDRYTKDKRRHIDTDTDTDQTQTQIHELTPRRARRSGMFFIGSSLAAFKSMSWAPLRIF